MIVEFARDADTISSRDALVVIIAEVIDAAMSDDKEHTGMEMAEDIAALVERSRFFRLQGANDLHEWWSKYMQPAVSAN